MRRILLPEQLALTTLLTRTRLECIGSADRLMNWPSPVARVTGVTTFMMAASSLISELRGSLSDESARIQREFEASGDGRAAVAQRTRLVEDILARLWRDIVSPDAGQTCQLRSGGHGRIRARLAVSVFRHRSAFSFRRSRCGASVQRSGSPLLAGTVGPAAEAESGIADAERVRPLRRRTIPSSPSLFSTAAILRAITTCFGGFMTK